MSMKTRWLPSHRTRKTTFSPQTETTYFSGLRDFLLDDYPPLLQYLKQVAVIVSPHFKICEIVTQVDGTVLNGGKIQ